MLTDAATGEPVAGPAPSVSIDLARRQITVEVPHSEWEPGTGTVRLAGGVGLWDESTGKYLLPAATRSATQPGGAGTAANPPAFFDVAFRFDSQEPLPGKPGAETTVNPAWWRESAQAQALAGGDISAFHADVDFGKLKAKTNDDMPGQPAGVPQSGVLDRILASHFAEGQGADYATGGCGSSAACIGALRGQLQPYAIYIPGGSTPTAGWGLTLLLHSLSANYNQFSGSRNQSQFAARGAGSIVITPSGRGPDGWYYDHAGADTFEVWADVAAHYKLDPDFTDIAGYSMGGYGTYKFTSQFPDLFARAQPTVGPPGLGVWIPPAPPEPGGEQSKHRTDARLGAQRAVLDLGRDDRRARADRRRAEAGRSVRRARLPVRIRPVPGRRAPDAGDQRRIRTGRGVPRYRRRQPQPGPRHVRLQPDDGLRRRRHGRRPRLLGLGGTLRDAGGSAPLGKVDVRSRGFGKGDAPPGATSHGAGVLTGGQIPAIPYTSQSKAWGATPSEPAADELTIDATNVSAFTIDARRAKVDCKAACTSAPTDRSA